MSENKPEHCSYLPAEEGEEGALNREPAFLSLSPRRPQGVVPSSTLPIPTSSLPTVTSHSF
jgi:hypothetical protein